MIEGVVIHSGVTEEEAIECAARNARSTADLGMEVEESTSTGQGEFRGKTMKGVRAATLHQQLQARCEENEGLILYKVGRSDLNDACSIVRL